MGLGVNWSERRLFRLLSPKFGAAAENRTGPLSRRGWEWALPHFMGTRLSQSPLAGVVPKGDASEDGGLILSSRSLGGNL